MWGRGLRKTRDDILKAVRTAAKIEGKASLGRLRFTAITGIREAAWKYYWARWSDLLAEAGLVAGSMTTKLSDDGVVLALVPLIKLRSKWPTSNEIRIYGRDHPGFPSDSTIRARGDGPTLAERLLDLCQSNSDLSDVARVCQEVLASKSGDNDILASDGLIQGYVYLMKSGKYHKIGKSKSPDRRRNEVALLLPDDVQTVHVIATDDPDGIEAYWQNRFKAKHHRGEFYRLDIGDVRAFKRRREYM